MKSHSWQVKTFNNFIVREKFHYTNRDLCDMIKP